MSKFKIGDRVKDATRHYRSYQLEESPVGTLKAHNGVTWTVEWDTNIGPDCWSDDQLALAYPSPVRTKTVTEIVPGSYGILRVGTVGASGARIPLAFDMDGDRFYDAIEINAAIETLIAIRDALQEQNK